MRWRRWRTGTCSSIPSTRVHRPAGTAAGRGTKQTSTAEHAAVLLGPGVYVAASRCLQSSVTTTTDGTALVCLANAPSGHELLAYAVHNMTAYQCACATRPRLRCAIVCAPAEVFDRASRHPDYLQCSHSQLCDLVGLLHIHVGSDNGSHGKLSTSGRAGHQRQRSVSCASTAPNSAANAEVQKSTTKASVQWVVHASGPP